MTIPWQTLTACYKPVQKQLKIKQTAKIQFLNNQYSHSMLNIQEVRIFH